MHAADGKGHGYPPAEADIADHLHTRRVVNPATGLPRDASETDVFETGLAALVHVHPEVVALPAAIRLRTGLGAMSRTRPGAVFDSGIAEQHLLACAAVGDGHHAAGETGQALSYLDVAEGPGVVGPDAVHFCPAPPLHSVTVTLPGP